METNIKAKQRRLCLLNLLEFTVTRYATEVAASFSDSRNAIVHVQLQSPCQIEKAA